MRWDAYVYAPDQDALAAQFADRFADGAAAFSVPLKDQVAEAQSEMA